MIINVLEKIESLPPLTQTIEEIEIYRKKKNKEAKELLYIVEKDPLVITTLLKVSNSSLFGFRSKVESIERVINLLGINFTVCVVINETINNILLADLTPYCLNSKDFADASIASSNLINLWIGKIDNELREKLLLASLLQEVGKFILSEVIVSRNLVDVFKQKIELGIDICDTEKELLGITTSQVTAAIFRYWKLSEELINVIEFVDDIDNCKIEYKEKVQILDVVKTACNCNSLLSEDSIQKAIKKAVSYNFDINILKIALQTLKERIS